MFQYHNEQPHSANQNYGGIFTLSPPDAATVMGGGEVEESFFPPGYVSFVSERFSYLLDLPDNLCKHGASFQGSMYSNGILCKVPLRALKIYSRNQVSGSAPSLLVEMWYNTLGTNGQSGPPAATQEIGFHQIGADYASNRQGYSVPVIPGTGHSYRISLANGGNVPDDWVVEFSDPVMSNRWAEEFLHLSVQGRQCVDNGLISSLHDRKFIYSGDEFMVDQAWGRHGACVGIGTQPPDSPTLDCVTQNEYGIGGEIDTTACPELCPSDCASQNAYCDCGTATCRCKAGFAGSSCEIDLCAAARCGLHGTCSARYLGTSSILPVTSDNACICDDGWSGPLCDKNPCQGMTCSGNGKCVADGNTAVCKCAAGYSGENCQQSCYGFCKGDYPFGCASNEDGKEALGCDSNRGCHYLGPGESYPHGGFCTYKSYTSDDSSCVCEAPSDCQEVGPCLSNGSCPAPSNKRDGTACNGIPWGVCANGQCVDSGNVPPAVPISSPHTDPVPAPIHNPTVNPTPAPVPAPTSPPVANYCGCQTCTDQVWNRDADGYSCGDRMEWLQSPSAVAVGGPFTEEEACRKISQEEYPEVCGLCSCTGVSVPAPLLPTPNPTVKPTNQGCETVCGGEYPFGCATNIPGKVKYGCYPGGACYYAGTLEEEYPWDGFCTFETAKAEPTQGNLRGRL